MNDIYINEELSQTGHPCNTQPMAPVLHGHSSVSPNVDNRPVNGIIPVKP